ncbi:phosphonate metabolism protein/1,5-bisphosphokinase (PRPP-forming) PhnN [Photobacterium frigidiphilum]|uniref:Ribose 1,5-bisphosphate phosphokinase PhnN n=1 Tax=Photobacterium frigidiphilum TaxID=264736 RepID=A0A2T3JNH6_9GAMM|nr:ribose 1,5-bisphosphokinase [Photobacterium frigidiphilum]PSU50571.1 phosphonate metabolism protein/1,5-bisphosphokinase (PRPP-forming) PhnN [Photobacterium frigidiphilum]
MARIFYVIGASGAGKDSVIDAVRQAWPSDILVAHRYITRAACAGGENHITLTEAEFVYRRHHDLFAMHWQANGLHYGVGLEVDLWLANGCDVMVNGSREFLPQALAQYGNLLVPVVVDVALTVLEQRLRTRGRETETEIQQRLIRARDFQHCALPDGNAHADMAENSELWRLDNSGTIAQTLAQFDRYYCAEPESKLESVGHR